MKTQSENYAKDQAASQYASICEMVANLDRESAIAHFLSQLSDEDAAEMLRSFHCENESACSNFLAEDSATIRNSLLEAMKNDDFEPEGFTFDEEQARETIQEDALSVEVRSGWETPGSTLTPSDFCILLCTGGPAVRIRGELNQHNEPERAWIEYQDWGTPWTQYFDADQDTLLAYAQQFYFGE